MAFYIELPQDKAGNRLFTNMIPRIIEAELIQDAMFLKVIIPSEDVFSWRKLNADGWVECLGPAREVSWDEREQILASG